MLMTVTEDVLVMPSDRPRLTIYLDSEEVKTNLERLAEMEDRPISNFVLRLIKDAIEKAQQEGKLPPTSS